VQHHSKYRAFFNVRRLFTLFFISGLLAPAVLYAQASCTAIPGGLIGWWRAEGTTEQAFGTNAGTLIGNASFGVGMAGQAFTFDGDHDAVVLSKVPALQLQDFTIEAWIQRATCVSLPSGKKLTSVEISIKRRIV
jgi:hypothetical protein